MGQKTHPLGFRLGITQEHRSAWYADFKHYSSLLEEDDKRSSYVDLELFINNDLFEKLENLILNVDILKLNN